MQDLLVSQIEAEKFFTQEVFLDEKYILLSPETPISEELLDRLSRWGFERVKTGGSQAEKPSTAAQTAGATEAPLTLMDQDIKDREAMEEANKEFRSLIEFTEKTFSRYVTAGELPQRAIGDKMKGTIDLIRERRKHILRLTELDTGTKNYIVDHSTKTALLSIAVGMSMKRPPHKLIELGTAALLHEIGMIRLPANIYMTDKPLDPQEKKAITAHTVLGYKILKQFDFPAPICLAVLECREHMDGSGYPRGLPAEKISPYARILAVTSSYAAMISQRPFRPHTDGSTAMMEILKGKGSRYDQAAIRGLIMTLSLYPYGTFVQLKNGSAGMVIDIDPEQPRFPTVKLITDASGTVLKERPTIPTTEDDYQVAGPLPHEEVQAIKSSL